MPETQTISPGSAPLRRISIPAATSPIAVSDRTAGPVVPTELPPRRSIPKRRWSSASPVGKAGEPLRPEFGGEEQSSGRNDGGRAPIAARSDRLTRNNLRATRSGGSSGKVMHSGDERVRGYDKTPPRRAIDERGIVDQPETAGPGKRREKAPDPLESPSSLQPSALHLGRAQAAPQLVEHAVG